MFTLASRFRASLALAALASALVLADPASHDHARLDHGRRHHGVNVVQRDSRVHKRFDNTRFTYFPPGTNACGGFDHENDFIVALNTHQWDGGSHCFEEITVEYQGKTAQAKITDECMECPFGAIDFSPGLFKYMVPGGEGQGVAYGSWNFGAADPGPTSTSTTTTKEKPTTTSKPPPSTTSTSTTPTTTKHSTTKTSSSTTPSTTSTTSSSTSTSSAPTATVTSWDTGNLNQFNLALISLAELSQAALANPGQA
ncbi:hypothetical protein K466DRAFT_563550 [Polyporus arcularius HHB13444]|uniref:RlpA-like protein double-psi beta-barrel domain-containing protein n=1 Tax=Polyporus arcularius HHB13444 TaxID=1314778 RepID=A0A5C3PRG9_9APHY|nr:hypothetical protein K466DRAFT_563550 [Polyporus arcularius HHB13444]